jgi:hypothetical protein
MSTETKPKSLGSAIDGMIEAISSLEEKDQQVAINAVCIHLGLSVPFQREIPGNSMTPPPPGGVTPPTHSIPLGGQMGRTDIRSFKEQKQPSSAREMACIVAFYLENLAPADETKTAISTSDITKYFKQAGYPLPSAIDQLLKDAKTAGYLDSGERGTYKLNPVGHNLVAHTLPRSGNSGQPRKAKVPAKRKKAAKKKK